MPITPLNPAILQSILGTGQTSRPDQQDVLRKMLAAGRGDAQALFSILARTHPALTTSVVAQNPQLVNQAFGGENPFTPVPGAPSVDLLPSAIGDAFNRAAASIEPPTTLGPEQVPAAMGHAWDMIEKFVPPEVLYGMDPDQRGKMLSSAMRASLTIDPKVRDEELASFSNLLPTNDDFTAAKNREEIRNITAVADHLVASGFAKDPQEAFFYAAKMDTPELRGLQMSKLKNERDLLIEKLATEKIDQQIKTLDLKRKQAGLDITLPSDIQDALTKVRAFHAAVRSVYDEWVEAGRPVAGLAETLKNLSAPVPFSEGKRWRMGNVWKKDPVLTRLDFDLASTVQPRITEVIGASRTLKESTSIQPLDITIFKTPEDIEGGLMGYIREAKRLHEAALAGLRAKGIPQELINTYDFEFHDTANKQSMNARNDIRALLGLPQTGAVPDEAAPTQDPFAHLGGN